METAERFDHPRLDEIMAYYRLKKELQRKHLGQWVILHGSQHIGGGFDSCHSASEAARKMGPDPLACFIRRVGADTAAILAVG